MQRGFRPVEKFLKGLSFRINSKNRYHNADFEQYKSFNPSDMITICMPTAKCAKIMKLMICICSEFLCRETFDNKPCKVRLGRAAEGWNLGWTRTEYVSKNMLLSRDGINQTNENTLSHFDTDIAQTVFWE